MMKFKSLLFAAALAAATTSSARTQGIGQLGAGQVWGNPTAAQRVAKPSSVSDIFDRAFGSTQGAIVERGVSSWGTIVLGSGVATFLATPTSANLAAAITNETGGGGLAVFNNAPVIITPNLTTGFTIGGAAASGAYARGNGTNFVSSTIQPSDLPLCSSSAFGACKVDNTTITAAGGVLSAIGGVATSVQPGTTSVTGGSVGSLLAVGAGPTLVQFDPAPINNSLGADVSLSSTGSYFDGPSIAQGTTGTWRVSGTVTVTSTVAEPIFCKLWDGTSLIASTSQTTTASGSNTMTLSGYLASPAANIKISCRDPTSTNGKILFNNTGNSKDSTVSADRIK